MAPTRRARGYHYIRLANGRKKRVYNTGRRGGRRQGGYRRKARVGKRGVVYSGYGAYHLASGYIKQRRANTTGRMEQAVPKIKNIGGRVVVNHTEFLGDVFSSEAFANNGYYLNPGLGPTEGGFSQWLWNVGQNFEEWIPRGICFHYKSTSAEYSNATGAALGTVSMATNYNTLNAAFVSKVAMENYDGSASTKPSKNMNHFVECARKRTPVEPLYIRTSSVIPANADQRMYDLGQFQIATSGMNSAGVTVGELWVSYEIEFLKPRLNPDPQGIFDHFQIPSATALVPATPFGTATAGLLFPTTSSTAGGAVSGGIVTAANCAESIATATKDNFLGGVPQANGTLGNTTANTYYFPPTATIGSVWCIMYNAQNFTTGVPGAWTITANNCQAKNLLNLDTLSAATNAGAGNTTSLMLLTFVTITAAFANLVLTNAGAQSNNAAAQWGDLYIFQLGQPVDPTAEDNTLSAGELAQVNALIAAATAGQVGTFLNQTTYTNAAIKAGSALTIVPAQGAGTYVQVQNIDMRFNYGGNNNFTSTQVLNVNWGANFWYSINPGAGFWEATANRIYNSYPTNTNDLLSNVENMPINVQLAAGLTGNAAADNTVTIDCYYKVVTL